MNRFGTEKLGAGQERQRTALLYIAGISGNILLIVVLFVVLRLLGAGRTLSVVIPTLYGGISLPAILYLFFTKVLFV